MRRGTPYLKTMDPVELSKFSTDQAINHEDNRSSNVSFKDLAPFLRHLPDRERDLLDLYLGLGKNQKDIAKLFGVTQGAISSRISRAKKRLRYLKDMPKINDIEIDKNLKDIFDEIEIEIIKSMRQTTCQSKTAQVINEKYGLKNDKVRMTQVKVRHRFEKCYSLLNDLKESKPEMATYFDLLHSIKDNLYMLHEVKLPHFDKGRCHVFSMST